MRASLHDLRAGEPTPTPARTSSNCLSMCFFYTETEANEPECCDMETNVQPRRPRLNWPIAAMIGIAGLVVVGAGILIAKAEPNSETLQGDIDKVDAELKRAEAEAAQYAGGALLALIEMRAQTLKATKAMMSQKQASTFRFIDLRYTIDGRVAGPATPEELSRIDVDRNAARAEIASKQSEIAAYSGGLIRSMGLMTIATKEVELAFLDLRYMSAKWGIPVYLSDDPVDTKTLGQPGTDDDAL